MRKRRVENVHAEEVSPPDEMDDETTSKRPRVTKVEKTDTDPSQNEDSDRYGLTEEDESSESADSDRSEYNESDTEEEESSDEDSSSEVEDNLAFQGWLDVAMESTEKKRTKKYEKFITQGMNKKKAKKMADTETLLAVKKNFFVNYKNFLTSYLHLKDDDTHKEILVDIEQKIDDGLTIFNAVSRVVNKHQTNFDALFQEK